MPKFAVLPLVLALATGAVVAQQQTSPPFEPKSGRPGKDVEWVPTPQELVDRMLDLAKLTPQDYLIDLGSGDGRTVITAAARGVRARGIEYDAELVKLSQLAAARAGVSARASFARADLFKSDLSKATVITMFLLPAINLQLRPKLLALKPGTRIVSNTWDMEEWDADEVAEAGPDNETWRRAYLWIVPARVEGAWRLQRTREQGTPQEGPVDVVLRQRFQTVTGTFERNGTSAPISSGRLWGDQIAFSVGAVRYQGRVNGNVMEGMAAGATWRATRLAAR